MIKTIRTSVALTLLLAACSQGDTDGAPADTPTAANALMESADGVLTTTHSLRYSITASPDFSLTPVDTRSDIFHDVPFEVSRAAFLRGDAAVMIHAETVADGSGASNYDDLPAVEWPVAGFRSGGYVCFELTQDDIIGEADPIWLIQNGFNPLGVLMFGQYFLTSDDHNDEIVISLMLHVDDCANEDANSIAYQALQSAISFEPAP